MPEPQHIRAKSRDIADNVIVSGDPARVVQLSELLESRHLVNENRGFLTYTGEYEGSRFTIACHGVGAPSAAIVVEELVMLGARAIVRLGTCGGLLKKMRIGDLVVATGAGYKGGTLDYYFAHKRMNFKPDRRLTELLVDSVKREGMNYHTGQVFSTDAFYAETPVLANRYRNAGYVAVEMECATLFGLGKLRGIRTGCVLLVSDNLFVGHSMVDAKTLGLYAAKAGRLTLKSLNQMQTQSERI